MAWILLKILVPLGVAALLGLILGWALRGIGLKGRMHRAVAERDLVIADRDRLRDENEVLFQNRAAHSEANRNGTSGSQELHAELQRRDERLKALTEELSTSKQELDRLRASRAEAKSAAPAATATTSGGTILTAIEGGGQARNVDGELEELRTERDELSWRNRYLESRVKMLEDTVGKMQTEADSQSASGGAPENAPPPSTEKAEIMAELDSLRTENASLKEALENTAPPKVDDKPENDQTAGKPAELAEIEQELARLRWRNRYLESRLDYLEGNPEVAEAEAQAESAAAPVTEPAEPTPEPAAEPEGVEPAAEEVEAPVATDQAEPAPEAVAAPEPEAEAAPEPEPEAVETSTEQPEPVAPEVQPEAASEPETETVAPVADASSDGVTRTEPQRLKAPRGGTPDNLQQIEGIGPHVETVLRQLGIYHFDQIASWGEAEAAWIDHQFGFRGRVMSEDWPGKARALLEGGATGTGA